MKAHQIKSGGMLHFTSNCSFATDVIKCASEPYSLELKKFHKTCFIHVGSLNKTLIATFDYILKGHLMQKYTEKNDIAILIDLIVSKAFLEGVLTSAITVLTIAFVSSLSIRLFKVWQFNRAARGQFNAKL